MLFNTFTFLLFFLAVVVISRLLGSWRLRKAFLLLASYLFYGAWNPLFVLLLIGSTAVDFFTAERLHRAETRAHKIRWLCVSLVVNLGILAYFKYGVFVADNVAFGLSQVGLGSGRSALEIILPVGISFYTFQKLSYTIDVWYGRLRPWRSFLDYALYVTFFPQLVAGPIVRARDFLPQCEHSRKATRDQLSWGLTLFVVGLFVKVVLADELMAPVVDRVYDGGSPVDFVSAWTATLAFSIQIFSDFFGYSTCAIGIALCLGFHLPDNFHWPYASLGFADFWRRWHISLSTWLRDYLYIPLGGNRRGVGRTYVHLAVVMLLGGLWHGASWMFVIWGGLHGAFLIVERLARRSSLAGWPLWSSLPGRLLTMAATYVAVCVAWVFFRAPDMTVATDVAASMLVPFLHTAPAAEGVDLQETALVLVIVVSMLGLHLALRATTLERVFERLPWWAHGLLLAAMAYLTLICMTGEDRAFIYFQF